MGGASFRPTSLFSHVKRSHGSGHLYVRYGSYYGRWRDELRERLAVGGAPLISPERRVDAANTRLPGDRKRRIDRVTRQDVERLGRAMLARGLAPKTVRNVMTFLHAVFALALANEWIERNPVAGAARPKRSRQGDANPDLRFLTVEQLDLVLAAIPDEIVTPPPTARRRGRAGPGPPPPPDVLGRCCACSFSPRPSRACASRS